MARGRDVVVFIFPDDHELCYECHYQKTLADRQTLLYVCCVCRTMKKADREAHREMITTCQIANGRLITVPKNPRRCHLCQPRSTPRARRLVIERCADIRRSEPHVLKALPTEVSEVLSEIGSERFGKLTLEL